jgi:deoxyribodipyrimidine photolyase-related protein
MTNKNKLIIILGDQLSHNLSALTDIDKKNDQILMMEVMDEASYHKHHKKKLAFIFASMRHFASELVDTGYQVTYIKLTDKLSKPSFTQTIKEFLKTLDSKPDLIVTTEASEYRVVEMQEKWEEDLKLDVLIKPDDRFIADHAEFAKWAEGRERLTMEFWYRQLRRRTGILMKGEAHGAKTKASKPIGDKWNFDAKNREAIKDPAKLDIPEPKKFKVDEITSEVIEMIKDRFADNFGELEPFWYATSAKDAYKALKHFLKEALPNFGKYQDAMVSEYDFLFHGVISLYLNIGFLDPLKVCRLAESEYYSGRAPINAVEGFIRQILGWREFIRGVYWLYMPEYKERNFLQADTPLPDFYWDESKTEMNCLKQSIRQTREHAYAHHIQRLMITGMFALLIGVKPAEINDWYMVVYFDAYEWVELPNTHGMAIYADGGVVGTKPYAASGSYINKMSNYCKNCKYNYKEKYAEDACPFNYLYWNFMVKHQKKLANNQRLRFAYNALERMNEDDISKLRSKAEEFIRKLSSEKVTA